MTKEEIIERAYNSTFSSPKYEDSVNKKMNLTYILPAMEAYSRQECIELIKYLQWDERLLEEHGDANALYELYQKFKSVENETP